MPMLRSNQSGRLTAMKSGTRVEACQLLAPRNVEVKSTRWSIAWLARRECAAFCSHVRAECACTEGRGSRCVESNLDRPRAGVE